MSVVNKYFWPDYDPERIYKEPDGSWKLAVVYVLHFERPVNGQPHYVGWSGDLRRRLLQHMVGEGSELTMAAALQGVRFVDTDVHRSTHMDERSLQMSPEAIASTCGICRRIEDGKHLEAQRLIRFRLAALARILDRHRPESSKGAATIEHVRALYARRADEANWF